MPPRLAVPGPPDLILMASVPAAHGTVLVSALSTGSQEPASVSRPTSRPNLDGLGLGVGHPCLGLGLGGPGLDYNPDLGCIRIRECDTKCKKLIFPDNSGADPEGMCWAHVPPPLLP